MPFGRNGIRRKLVESTLKTFQQAMQRRGTFASPFTRMQPSTNSSIPLSTLKDLQIIRWNILFFATDFQKMSCIVSATLEKCSDSDKSSLSLSSRTEVCQSKIFLYLFCSLGFWYSARVLSRGRGGLTKPFRSTSSNRKRSSASYLRSCRARNKESSRSKSKESYTKRFSRNAIILQKK